MRTGLSGKSDMISESENTQPCDMFEKPVTNKELHCNKLIVETLGNKGENGFLTKREGGSSSGCQKFLKQTYEILGRMKPLTATEKDNAFNSVNPSFRIVMHPYSIRYECVSLPNEFTRRYLMKLPAGIVKLRVLDGRTWSVKFKYDHLNSRARLHGGWSSFVRGNSLKVGDVCIFTLINCIELLFEVVFFHTKDSANCPSSTGHGRGASVQVEEKKHPILEVEPDCSLDCKIGKNNLSKISGQVTQMPSSSLRTSRVNLEAASKFSSKNPFFKVIMGSGHTMHIPANFSRSFIKHEKQTAILQVKNRSWHVNLNPYKPGATSICGGWAAFAKENCLREGDVCIFELMELNDIVLKVHVFRC
uniref:putative B3 domain-containing protein Os03g0621600 isoform X1 n=1 Tax=Fragaria vesca subsp. vesca TaxID=101020 RepID=UPI0005C864F7|nr:PREDICTED: putative B3 domain-containing protein Os03g0621600 isoform X1 [Fragaria vesca subsp. vesca]XP_011467599.1 PREDICTED: putative B3 domain-containing protein Os03g0621600 isoform X1 [Fragaria vesca subsp. vesca]XP_011467600.1 PREDICTED: putative B3 domain-containing protein Os03g0621600 isoform X1 [Fragaria vesca subsp. vesca]XP_011467601.1 PREDICTED: putative B3 domain-containing protein Os03g0621600 isoform X1 [Fragaria vesca subsp. vesca]